MYISMERREAEWRRHLQAENLEYDEFDRNLSDKVSVPRSSKPCGADEAEKKEKKEQKQKKEKTEKKDKKQKSDDAEKKTKKDKKEKRDKQLEEVLAPSRGVTILGMPKVSEGDVRSRADDSDGCKPPKSEDVDPVKENGVALSLVPAGFKLVQRSADLTWQNLLIHTRELLLKSGRMPAADFLDRWANEYGYQLKFPFFDVQDLPALVVELQPVALAILAKKDTVIAASSDSVFAKSQEKATTSQRCGTFQEWLVASLETELKTIKQRIVEKKRAQADAEARTEKLRQDYRPVQSQNSAHSRALKADIAKQEQKVNKFRQEKEEQEKLEKALLPRLTEEQHALRESPAST